MLAESVGEMGYHLFLSDYQIRQMLCLSVYFSHGSVTKKTI